MRTQLPQAGRTADPARPDPRRWAALAVLSLAQFMVILDLTVVNVALPEIGADLALDRAGITWVMTGYTLAFGGLMLLGGRLADVAGRRRTFLAGLAVFTVASLVSGLAPGGEVLVAARVAQGVGAALLSPAALSIVTTTFHGAERHRALGVWAAIGGAGAAVGVLVGGVLSGGPGWQWVFYVNVPVGVVVGLVLPRLVAAGRPAGRTGRIDLPGAVLVTLATGLLIYGLVRAGDAGWASAGALLPIAAGVAVLLGFAVLERAVRQPLVRLAVVARRQVAAGVAVMLAASGLLLAGFFLSSQYLQRALELGPVRTGLAFLPVAVIITVGAHLGARLVGRAGPRRVAATGFAVAAVGAALLARLPADGSVLVDLLPGFMLLGGGLGAAFVTATTTALTGVGHDEAGLVSGLVNTGHELGAALGVAVMSTVAVASLGGAPGAVVPVDGFRTAFAATAVVAGVVALGALALLPAHEARDLALVHTVMPGCRR
jgi:EmrB/QacA subfamily drug resistance transporter